MRSDILRWCRELALDFLALLWPTSCAACAWPDRELCDRCRDSLNESFRTPQQHLGLGVPCYVLGPYDGALRSVLVAYKHGGVFGFSRVLGALLATPLRAACSEVKRGPPMIVTVPSRPQRVRERGYRHVDECVRVALRVGRIDAPLHRVLKARRGRTGQVGLTTAERERNASQIAVRLRFARARSRPLLTSRNRSLAGAEVIIVDDVVTTGATMRAAIDELERAGARVVAAVALCATVRRDTREKTLVGGSH